METGLNKKNSTKVFLAESLRVLVQHMPFQSITIKKICDEAGVVRVTFYNYFVDKYDALDYLIQSDLSAGIQLGKEDPMKCLLEHLAAILVRHRKFYEIAAEIDGQNGFQEIFISQMKDALLHILKTHRKMMPQTSELDNVTLAETYAVMIFYLVKRWLKGPSNAKEDDFLKDAVLMCHSSLYDFID